MLDLNRVTLLVMDTSCHQLSRMAIDDTINKTKFGDVLIFTDQPEWFDDLGHEHTIVNISPYQDKFKCGQDLWRLAPLFVKTDYVLTLQWDSWIIDPTMWTDEFLEYDYIGAPWWYGDGLNVGNGGFSLRSKKLMNFLRLWAQEYPLPDKVNEDQALCRVYRKALEVEGFKWAPDILASRFSLERIKLGVPGHFGFHGIFNWPLVLPDDELRQRLSIARSNHYISNCGMMTTLAPEYR